MESYGRLCRAIYIGISLLIWGLSTQALLIPTPKPASAHDFRAIDAPKPDYAAAQVFTDHQPRDSSPLISNTTFPQVESKPIFESTYQKYQGKGCKLYSMLLKEFEPPATPWLSSSDLRNWGWRTKRYTTSQRIGDLLNSFSGPLQDLGLGVTPDDNVDLQVEHSGTTIQGSEYKPTNAKYFEVYNPVQGAIIAYRNYGPDHYSKFIPDWNNAPLPKLKQWSDIVFLSWQDITSDTERRNLKYVIRSSVQNQDTLDVVEAALKKEGVSSGKAPGWPGHTFKPDGNGMKPFQAVLGTPNASGVAWLLAQHREDLGEKIVTAIQVWDKSGLENQNAGVLLGMVVHIGNLAS